MSIIYRKNDLVKLKIGDLIFGIKPLTYLERVEIMSHLTNASGVVTENAAKATYYTMKFAIRSLEGAKLLDGSDYVLTFDENKNLSDDSLDDLLNIESNDKLGLAIWNFLKGVPAVLIDPNTNEPIEGVEIVTQKGVPKK